MFNALRSKLLILSGRNKYSCEDLKRLELDSVDSICLSDTVSIGMDVPQSESESIKLEAQRKVRIVLRAIKKMDGDKKSKLVMLEFFDILHNQYYKHVSIGLLSNFMKSCRMVPKNIRIHQYMYFLCYAMYYHNVRSTVDIVCKDMKQRHHYYLRYVKYQLNYLQYIIDNARLYG